MGRRRNIDSWRAFQLTTSRRGRPLSAQNIQNPKYFNSRPHEEVDSIALSIWATYSISTHDLTKRSTNIVVYQWFLKIFQLTTSRRGRRCTLLKGGLGYIISTHDLTKRSTEGGNLKRESYDISTHDLTKRSTYHPCHG